jgi:glutamyl/glutaminyl-tRNA synthetase
VVDDAEMGITHILRGQEHLLNTINHIALQEALGYARPVYGHLPVILNTDGSKMGKRDRDKKVRHFANIWLKNSKKTAAELAELAKLPAERVSWWLENDTRQLEGAEQKALMPVINLKVSDLPEILVHDFRANGYLPEVLLNFLALLGWSPGGDKERMSVKEMVELFTIDRIGQANAKFNREKLIAFNTEACAALGPEGLLGPMRDFLSVNPESPLNKGSDEELKTVLAMNAGMRTLREAEEKSQFLFMADESLVYQRDAIEKVLLKNEGQGLNALKQVREVLAGVGDFSAHSIEEAIQRYCEASGLGLGKVAQPIRVAVSGSTVSPPIFETLHFLGKDRTIARIDRCIIAATSK